MIKTRRIIFGVSIVSGLSLGLLAVVCIFPDSFMFYRFDETVVPGEYIGDYDVSSKMTDFYMGGRHFLTLYKDGTYAYRYMPKEGQQVTIVGRWKLVRNRFVWDISLSDFAIAPASPDAKKYGLWITYFDFSADGRLAIVIDDDVCYYFIKKNTGNLTNTSQVNLDK